MNLRAIVRLVRPHQYTKNLLLFAAPGAAGRLDEGAVLLRAVMAFVLFCAVSSAGYVANDLADVEADRQHPTKRHRPIASGAVPPALARRLVFALAIVSLVCAFGLGVWFVLALAGYALVTFSYSSGLKRVPWIELLAVSAGFVIRAVAGGAATDTPLSPWFLVVVSSGALCLIAGKRLGEMLTLGAGTPTRPVLTSYSVSSLRAVSAVAVGLAVAGYAAWAWSEARNRAPGPDNDLFLRLTIVPFVVAVARYLDLGWRGKAEAPDLVIFRDPLVLGAGAVWAILYMIGLYT